jgi:hypothetical protein
MGKITQYISQEIRGHIGLQADPIGSARSIRENARRLDTVWTSTSFPDLTTIQQHHWQIGTNKVLEMAIVQHQVGILNITDAQLKVRSNHGNAVNESQGARVDRLEPQCCLALR